MGVVEKMLMISSLTWQERKNLPTETPAGDVVCEVLLEKKLLTETTKYTGMMVRFDLSLHMGFFHFSSISSIYRFRSFAFSLGVFWLSK